MCIRDSSYPGGDGRRNPRDIQRPKSGGSGDHPRRGGLVPPIVHLEAERPRLLTSGLSTRGYSLVIYPKNSPAPSFFVVRDLLFFIPVSYTHLRAHETPEHLVCRLLLEKKKKNTT